MVHAHDAMTRFEQTLPAALDRFADGLHGDPAPAGPTGDSLFQDIDVESETRPDPRFGIATAEFEPMAPGALRRLLAGGALPGFSPPQQVSPLRSPGNGRTAR